MRTFDRWLYRIFIPFAVVALVAAVLRWTMFTEFAEENVRPAGEVTYRETAERDRADEETLPYSEENKEHVVAALELSKSQLDQSLEQSVVGSDPETQRQSADLQESIQNVKTADQENWESRRDEAYRQLRQYADAVGQATAPSGG